MVDISLSSFCVHQDQPALNWHIVVAAT
jgi:hypothetical protein